MSKIFIHVLNISISAGYLVMAVLLFRLFLKKAPRWISVLMWGIVGLRLILPFSIESVISLIPSAETVSPDIMLDNSPNLNTGIPVLDVAINPIIENTFSPTTHNSVNPLQIWIPVISLIWAFGVIAFLVYAVCSYIKIEKSIRTAVLLRDNIFQSESVSSPFVLGIIKPKIYIPFNMTDKNQRHVISHEVAHIKRKDHLWKPIGFLLLSLYWFNPLIWLSYILLCRDIEFACDERVIKELDRAAKAEYSEALIEASITRSAIRACPIAFGEIGVKERIKSVLSYKRPAFWIIAGALACSLILAACFLTNPEKAPDDSIIPNNSPIEPEVKVLSEYEGVYMSLVCVKKSNYGHRLILVKLHNETPYEVTFGDGSFMEYKNENGDWNSVKFRDMPFEMDGYTLTPGSTLEKKFTTAGSNFIERGIYRLRLLFSVNSKAYNLWMEFEGGPGTGMENTGIIPLDYRNVDASNGLDVIVWQMAKESFSFALLPHSDQPRDHTFSDELLELHPVGVNLDTMRQVLKSYDIPKERIYVFYWYNPLSSYINFELSDHTTKKAFMEQLYKMLLED